MTSYALDHLTQDGQEVFGPIQDDEALLLFALIRCRRNKTVLEAGGQHGYSARNFLEAVGSDGTVFSVDTEEQHRLAHNHITLRGCISAVDMDTLPPLDLVFYDCHDYGRQLEFHRKALEAGVIHDGTLLVLHDTGLHSRKAVGWAKKVDGGWVHGEPERAMVNKLVEDGWHAVSVHDDDGAVVRHGITLMQRFKELTV